MDDPTPAAPAPVKYAVRREWPDGGHDYFRLSNTPGAAQNAIQGDVDFWRRGPIRPASHRVVAMTEAAFEQHRATDRCKSADCP